MGLFKFLIDGYVDICATCGHEMAKEVQANRIFKQSNKKVKRYHQHEPDNTETLDDSPLDD